MVVRTQRARHRFSQQRHRAVERLTGRIEQGDERRAEWAKVSALREKVDAVRYEHIGYSDILAKYLKIMDASAVAMCRYNKMAIQVFNLNFRGNIMRMAMGEPIGTVIRDLSARDLDYETGQPNDRAPE